MHFIDTHSHVIAHWDDGAADWDVSLDMLREAAADGISEIVCTPHIMSPADLNKEDELLKLYHELLERSFEAKIPVKIHMGSELYLFPELQFDRKISTLAQNGRYYLVEFPMALIPEYAPQFFFDHLMDGKTPILAHPERNAGFLEKPSRAFDFVERGCLMQVTASSLLGNFGTTVRNTAFQLMDANLVHLVASDAHNLTSRPLALRAAFDLVTENWGIDLAKKLFYENPHQIIQNKDIKIAHPRPVKEVKNKSLKGMIKNFFK